MTRRPGRRSGGFTLPELVTVLVIVALLAAAALPRFIQLQDEADQARFEQVRAAFETGVSLVRVQALAQTARLTHFGRARRVVYTRPPSRHGGHAMRAASLASVRTMPLAAGFPDAVTLQGVIINLTPEGWPAIDQDASCPGGVASTTDGAMFADAAGSPTTVIAMDRIKRRYAGIGGIGGGGGGGDGGNGGGGGCSLLELLVLGARLDTWTSSTSARSVTFTSPSGRSFTYDESTGRVE